MKNRKPTGFSRNWLKIIRASVFFVLPSILGALLCVMSSTSTSWAFFSCRVQSSYMLVVSENWQVQSVLEEEIIEETQEASDVDTKDIELTEPDGENSESEDQVGEVPGAAEEPEEPTDPEVPEEPTDPEVPEEPTEPEEPEEPTDPEVPEEPKDSEISETPEAPEELREDSMGSIQSQNPEGPMVGEMEVYTPEFTEEAMETYTPEFGEEEMDTFVPELMGVSGISEELAGI